MAASISSVTSKPFLILIDLHHLITTSFLQNEWITLGVINKEKMVKSLFKTL